MSLNVVFCEGLQLQNVIIFLISMKHKYLLTEKTTEVNDCLEFLHRVKELMKAIVFMLEEIFAVWLWLQVNLCGMYMSSNFCK